MKCSIFLFFLLSCCPYHSRAAELASTCYGTTKEGRLENGWQLPVSGKNFEAYSPLGVFTGRNYVHSKVYEVVIKAYDTLLTTAPGIHFVYGESGFKHGGRFWPHKTHANGLSVDFFVPVRNEQGLPDHLPISIFNKLGYNIQFNPQARYKQYTIDFEAMAKHLQAIKNAANSQGIGITVVIFDNALQQKLFTAPTGQKLPEGMHFSTKKPWVKHDQHYHIDFDVPCSPLN